MTKPNTQEYYCDFLMERDSFDEFVEAFDGFVITIFWTAYTVVHSALAVWLIIYVNTQ